MPVAGPARPAPPSRPAAGATSPADGGPRLLAVRVKPRSAQDALEQQPDGSWVARLRAPPVDGRANEALIALVAAHFGRPRSAVRLVSGATARLKRVAIG